MTTQPNGGRQDNSNILCILGVYIYIYIFISVNPKAGPVGFLLQALLPSWSIEITSNQHHHGSWKRVLHWSSCHSGPPTTNKNPWIGEVSMLLKSTPQRLHFDRCCVFPCRSCHSLTRRQLARCLEDHASVAPLLATSICQYGLTLIVTAKRVTKGQVKQLPYGLMQRLGRQPTSRYVCPRLTRPTDWLDGSTKSRQNEQDHCWIWYAVYYNMWICQNVKITIFVFALQFCPSILIITLSTSSIWCVLTCICIYIYIILSVSYAVTRKKGSGSGHEKTAVARKQRENGPHSLPLVCHINPCTGGP